LATGNKSELSVGYCTLYGDMCGAIAPLGDVYKTEIWPLARHLNRNGEVIPENSISKLPSAELKETQTDQDTLPPYDVLDAILQGYMESPRSVDDIKNSAEIDPKIIEKVLEMVHHAEYKRSQSPPILMLSDRVFGQGRRWPIAHQFDPSREPA
jgi:NAD+ synthetase